MPAARMALSIRRLMLAARRLQNLRSPARNQPAGPPARRPTRRRAARPTTRCLRERGKAPINNGPLCERRVNLVALREDGKAVAAATVWPLDGEVEVGNLAELQTVRDALQVLALAEDKGAEIGVQWRRHARADLSNDDLEVDSIGVSGVVDLRSASNKS